MRNINNQFETRPIEVLDPISREVILRTRTLSKAKDYLKLSNDRLISDFVGTNKVLFSKTLNQGVTLIDYKERWQSKQNMILVRVADKKK